MYILFLKRALDFFISFVGLVILSPILIIVSIFLTAINQGRPWFVQHRPGKDGKLFRIIKFKTMTDEKDEFGELLPDARRLTRLGKIIRSTSLDEIPQLFNVLCGNMSLVGPRPLLPEYLDKYSAEQFRRHEVRPGITGWAQVNGRNTLNWQERFELDVWYVDNISFTLDMKILFKTVSKVFKRDGVSSSTSITMEKFEGN